MSKGGERLRKYETTIIFDPALSDEAIEKEIKKVEEQISGLEGKILKVEKWGLRRLAYQIAKKSQGFYVFVLFEGQGSIPAELERNFRLSEVCLRYLTVVSEQKESVKTEPPKRS
jgi:small subunit ribosomal protein S6